LREKALIFQENARQYIHFHTLVSLKNLKKIKEVRLFFLKLCTFKDKKAKLSLYHHAGAKG
jgi:hypothetical protein